MARVYKHCVVGHGLTGTAACRHLAEMGEDVVLVGPSEGNGAHGACYDEGRIYRILDPLESWARLAEASIDRYDDIAERAEQEFYSESGLLIFGVKDAFVKQTQQVASKMGTHLTELSRDGIKEKYPWMGVPPSTDIGLLQLTQAGHLSPRKLTQAQLTLAVRSGAEYVDANVGRVHRSSDTGNFLVSTAGGELVEAENVLVAAGVYTSLLPMLPEQLELSLTGAQAMLVEVSPDAAASLMGMPSMIYEGETEEDCMYLLPPIQYPDGSWLIKIGPSTAFSPVLGSLAEVDAWFRRGHLDEAFESKALAIFKELFQDVEIMSHRPLLCVTDSTPTQNAYVDLLETGWGVCTGGNGWAAKSSDQIGFLAAQMLALPQHWTADPNFPRHWFRAVTPTALLPAVGGEEGSLRTALATVEAWGLVPPGASAEALQVLTNVLAAKPRLRMQPHELAARMREEIAVRFGEVATVMCAATQGAALAPSHPFIALRADPMDVIILFSIS